MRASGDRLGEPTVLPFKGDTSFYTTPVASTVRRLVRRERPTHAPAPALGTDANAAEGYAVEGGDERRGEMGASDEGDTEAHGSLMNGAVAG